MVDSAVEVLTAEVQEREPVVAEALVWVDLLVQPEYYSRPEFVEEALAAVVECAVEELEPYAHMDHLPHSALLDQLYVAVNLGHRGIEVDIRWAFQWVCSAPGQRTSRSPSSSQHPRCHSSAQLSCCSRHSSSP